MRYTICEKTVIREDGIEVDYDEFLHRIDEGIVRPISTNLYVNGFASLVQMEAHRDRLLKQQAAISDRWNLKILVRRLSHVEATIEYLRQNPQPVPGKPGVISLMPPEYHRQKQHEQWGDAAQLMGILEDLALGNRSINTLVTALEKAEERLNSSDWGTMVREAIQRVPGATLKAQQAGIVL